MGNCAKLYPNYTRNRSRAKKTFEYLKKYEHRNRAVTLPNYSLTPSRFMISNLSK